MAKRLIKGIMICHEDGIMQNIEKGVLIQLDGNTIGLDCLKTNTIDLARITYGLLCYCGELGIEDVVMACMEGGYEKTDEVSEDVDYWEDIDGSC